MILGLISLAGAYCITPNIEDGKINIRNTLCSLINCHFYKVYIAPKIFPQVPL